MPRTATYRERAERNSTSIERPQPPITEPGLTCCRPHPTCCLFHITLKHVVLNWKCEDPEKQCNVLREQLVIQTHCYSSIVLLTWTPPGPGWTFNGRGPSTMIAEQESPDLEESFWNLTGENLENGEYQRSLPIFVMDLMKYMYLGKHPKAKQKFTLIRYIFM